MTTEETLTFGAVLKRYRVASGLTHEQLAERAGLSVRGISDLERGVRVQPRAYTVHQLAEALALAAGDRAIFEAAARAEAGLPAAENGWEIRGILGTLPEGELIAREDERERLLTALASARDNVGHTVLLGGEPGIGKTRLLQHVAADALDRGYVVAGARCSAQQRDIPLAAVLEALAGLATTPPDGSRTEVQRAWKRIVRLGTALGSAGNGSGAHAVERQELSRTIIDLVLLVSRSVPVVLLLDDLQWADEESLTVLIRLARAARNAAVLVIGAFSDVRVSEQYPALAEALQILTRERLADRLSVRRLSLEETTRFVGTLMDDRPVSEEFAAFVYRRTKGNPRLIEQLVHSLGGRLELEGEIGAGSMGRVFRAYDRDRGEEVAAKLVLARAEIDLDALLRFQQEGAVLAQLAHPHIVRIHDTFAEEHASCLIMELLPGHSLGQLLQDGPLPLARARTIALQVADALAYAHSQEIVHRDIKPDNVMVLPGDQVKVTDFGIARLLRPDTSLGTMATTGMRLGTPLYMAPEQIEGTRIDGRTDLYALGALLYHLVTGRPPFAGRDALTVAVKQLQEAPRPPSRVEPTIPEEWDALILKALAKAPRDRYQSAGEMQRAIEALPIAPAGSRPGGIRRHTLPAVIAGTGAACVSVMVILAILWAHVVAGQGQSPLQQKLEGYLTSLATQRQLSGTVLVAEKGKILLAQGYGMANRQKNIPNSPTTVYPVPGVGAILVPAALKLEEEGRLHDQDHVCSYLPSCPRLWKSMTIHMVLAGTAGLSNSAWGTFGNTTAQSLANCQGEPLTATPGSGPVNYQSCTGIVLGTIMSRVTHEPFVAAMRQLIFGPAGMRQSGLITDRSPPPGLAQGYSGSALGQAHAYSDFFQLYSTAGDLYRYDNTLFGGRLLSQTALREVVAPRDVVALPDPGIAGARWGYHWKVGSAFGHQVIYTTGNSWSFTGTNMRFPAEGITIIVISNDDQNDVEGVATHVAATLFGASAASPSQAIAPAVAPARAIVAAINVPAGFGIAASPNAIWVPGPPSPPAQVDSGSVVRIDPRTNRVVATVRINDPAGLANSDPAITFVAVGDGQVWITDRVRNSVDRIDPARNRVVARIPVGIHPFGLAIAGHTLWTDNSYEDPGVVNNTIVKVDLRTQKVVARITNAQTHIGQPYLELHATPTALWFTDWGSGTLKRLDSATDKVVATVQTGPQPTSIAVAPGAIWVSNHTSTLVTRVDPATNSMAATIPFTGYTTGQNTASDCCFSATAAGAGAIWTVAGANTRTLVRIDPRTNEATAALTFPQSIDVIAVADGSVWVGTGGRIDRIDPKAVR